MTPTILQAIQAVPADVSVYYQNLNSRHCWSYQADQDMPAASVIKVAILICLLQQVQRGQLRLTQEIQVEFKHHVGGAGVLFELHDGITVTLEDLARLMIVVSDNVASNLLLDTLPAGALQEFFRQQRLAQTQLGRRFMENPRPGHDNRTSAYDMGIMMAALCREELLDRAHTQLAFSILRRQQYREKIPQRLPPELSVAHKTGELDGVRHDIAIVEAVPHSYVLCLLTQKGGPAWDVDQALAQLSLLIYERHQETTL